MTGVKLAAATLSNAWVRLEPLEARHRAEMIAAAEADPDIFRHMPYPVAEHGFAPSFDWLLNERAEGRWIPHAVIAHAPPRAGELSSAQRETEGGVDNTPLPLASLATSPASGGGIIVGQSCYLTIRPRDAGVEIGGTWYVRAAQGTAINPAAKLALLDHAFACGIERVEFKTDALNAQSRAALTKLGATFEGVHRRHMRRPNGTWRDSAYFSIIREDWPHVRANLEARLAAFR
ncbi:MAG TPA: GNAT family protein [Vitreimonas sp.]|uniref:GNAT family N-acetyltransferase n=1 Tax=Vitreimonas sp. TaxID=3069702 RepID=UPI002D2C40C3|nr:GNAT family protein [Vitreimonas sp.]HYD87212.1 GNAT family protein [Vitreimonas sp.]